MFRVSLYTFYGVNLMARVKWFENEQIVVYIYGELYEKHHAKHVLVVNRDESCQYGFDGQPIKGTKRLKKRSDHEVVSSWIQEHEAWLNHAWELMNQGINPGKPD